MLLFNHLNFFVPFYYSPFRLLYHFIPAFFLYTGNASGQPDLLCAQNRFPNYLDPSGIAGPGAGAGPDVNLNNSTGNPPDLPQADLLSGQHLGVGLLSGLIRNK